MKANLIRRIWKGLKSTRLSVGLFLLLILFLLSGFFIPQTGRMIPANIDRWHGDWPRWSSAAEWMGLTQIYASKPMAALVALLLINTGANAAGRIRAARRQFRVVAGEHIAPAHAESEPAHASLDLKSEDDGIRAAALFRSRGYFVSWADDRSGFRGVRHRYAPLGSLIFHLSFFLVVVGVLGTVLYRFDGIATVAEGETFNGERETYLAVSNRWGRSSEIPLMRFKVEQLDFEFDDRGDVVKDTCRIRDPDSPDRLVTLGVNNPYVHNGVTARLSDFDLALLWEQRGADGRVSDSAWVKLMVYPPGKKDLFHIPDPGWSVQVRYFPDYVETPEGPSSPTRAPRNPRLWLKVEDADHTLYEGIIRIGDAVPLGEGSLSFPATRYWGQFEVNHDPGKPIVLVSLSLAAVGLAFRLLLHRRFVVAALEATDGKFRLHIGGHADYYRRLHAEEFADQIADLKKEPAHERT